LKEKNEVCHGGFHDILPKECSRTFFELLWRNEVTIKRDITKNKGSDRYFSLKRLILYTKQTFYYIYDCNNTKDQWLLPKLLLPWLLGHLIGSSPRIRGKDS